MSWPMVVTDKDALLPANTKDAVPQSPPLVPYALGQQLYAALSSLDPVEVDCALEAWEEEVG